MSDAVTSFMSLFVGNDRSFGRFFPEREPEDKRHITSRSAYEYDHFRQHLLGVVGLGIVPILDDGTVRFAAIDIDAHGDNDMAIDVMSLERRVREKDLPLVVCRSKGKGAHLYAFFTEPVSAQTAKTTLQRWASDLGYAGCEVFPKQTSLPVPKTPDAPRALGQWINLPYFGGTSRVCVDGGKEIGVEAFLEVARGKAMSADQFATHTQQGHGEAPPCIQRMMSEGIQAGQNKRNNALFNAVVYFRRAFPDTYRQHAKDFNAAVFSTPLSPTEFDSTVRSVARNEYSYKCKEEPCVSLCDRKTCLTRAHGIKINEGGADSLPEVEFTALMKWDSTPVRWQICVNNVPLMFSTNELHSFACVRARVFEVLHVWIKSMAPSKWEATLNTLSQTLAIVETPPDVSTHGIVMTRLLQYLDTAGPDDGEDHRAEFAARAKPSPVWVNHDSSAGPKRYVIFDFADFREHLQRNRSDLFKTGIDLHAILKQHCGTISLRLKFSTGLRTIQAMPAEKLRRYAGAAHIPASDL